MRNVVGILVVLLAARPVYADAGDRWDGVMIAQQSGAGIGGGLLGGGVGLFVGLGIGTGLAGGDKGDWGAPLGGAVLGGAVGTVAGITIGVKLAGDERGGNGSWGATFGGAIGGGLLTILTASQYGEKLPMWATMSLMTVTLVTPAIVGYHLSSDENATTEKRVMVPIMLSAF